MESAIWGVIGTVLGALASIGTTWLSGHTSHKLQSERAREERMERANAFQRQTLLDLQDTIHDALRLVHKAHLEDVVSYRAGKAWGASNLSEEVNEGIRIAQRRVAILVERISHDPLRGEVKALTAIMVQALQAKSEREAQAHLETASARALEVLESLGTTLRAHY